jgi:uncharacterized repeat protein (TIGR03803 family)
MLLSAASGPALKLTAIPINGTGCAFTKGSMMQNFSTIVYRGLGILLLLLGALGWAEEPWVLSTLAQFDLVNGQNCWAGLAKGLDGNFYGVSLNGGTNGEYGTVFRLTTNGNLSSIYSFDGTNGAWPQATLLRASDGNFYGSATFGGVGFDRSRPSSYGNGLGTLFRISPAGEFATLVQFNGTNGAYPATPLMEASDGLIYGVSSDTLYGGHTNTGGHGKIFSLSTNGEYLARYAFSGTNGDSPIGKLLEVDGSFYGTCYDGGRSNVGTIFRFDTNGSLTTVLDFAGTNGAWPLSGLVRGPDGQFYGTTAKGGMGYGTVYRLTTNEILTTLHSFNAADGDYSDASLARGHDDALYGVTANGGQPSLSPQSGNVGTLYKITTNGVFTSLVAFNNLNGVSPIGELAVDDDGSFYGTTSTGGAVNTRQVGGVFRYGPAVSPMIYSGEVGGFEDFPLLQFKWQALGGVRYGVQVNSSLDPLGWTDLGGENPLYTYRPTPGELSSYPDFSIENPFQIMRADQQFFRLVILPP